MIQNISMEALIKAYDFAAQKHRNQRRKDSEKTPYINHPIQVAYLLSLAGVKDPDVIMAGVLHDTIEDTATSYDELVTVFGKHVADIVIECTDDKSLDKVQRKKLQIEHSPLKSKEAKLVKLADKYSNLSDIHKNPPATWSQGEIDGYITWAFAVVKELRGTNEILENSKRKCF